jgi:hypothetical protein
MTKFAYLAGAVIFVSTPLLAQAQVQQAIPQPVAPAKVANSKSDADKVECRSQDELGSRLQRHQVCMTKGQWYTYEQENKKQVQDLQQLTPTRPSGM